VLWLLAGPVSNLALLYGSSYQLQTAPLDLLLVLLAFGSILGLLGAWLAVSRHLAQIEPE
jgi:cell division transport system permease protein